MITEELEHSERGPSGATAWRACPGKLNMERGRPDKVRHEAAEGSVFHNYAAMCLDFGFEPENFPLGQTMKIDGYEIAYDAEMRACLQDGLAWIWEHVEPGDILLVEQKLDISPWCGPGEIGTGDVTIIKVKQRRVIIFDWKYGKGVPVSPVENDQCYLYFLGVWHTFKLLTLFGYIGDITVEFVIEQPRCAGGGGYWKTDAATCLAEGEKIKIDAEATRAEDAPRVPGVKQCMFCLASGHCPEQAAWLLETYGQKFEDIELNAEYGLEPVFPEPETLTPTVRSYILLHWPAFKKFVDRCHAIVLQEFRAGHDVPLVKAIVGRAGARTYLPDEVEEAGKVLTELVGPEKAFVTKPISPAQAEDLIGKKVYAEKLKKFVTQAPGKIQLVSKDHKGEAIQDFASKFGDIDDEFTDSEDD